MPDVLLGAAGNLRRAYEAVDWGATSIGAIEDWSPTLRTTVDLILNTQFPITLLWGPQFVLVYNEAYVELIADKHPNALGRPAREIFPEIWDEIGPMMQAVHDGAGPTWVEDAPLPLERHGLLEEAYFTFAYSPVRNARGEIEGVLDIATETTHHVVARRRLALLTRLRGLLGTAESAEDIARRALIVLRAAQADLLEAHVDLNASTVDGPAQDGIARLSLGTGGGVLIVRMSQNLAPDEAYLGFLRLIASSIGQALDRVRVRAAERGVSEALQRSLLVPPSPTPGTEVAVRYVPAQEQSQVGGDWYDAFVCEEGAHMVVVGDVTGHDRWAAAAMAQIRNLLRGIAFAGPSRPSEILGRLDTAMHGLGLDVFATAVLGRLHEGVLTFSSAGHLPPVLIEPDGRSRLLETKPNVLLGIGRALARDDHEIPFAPGATIVFYTDGLVERRGTPLDDRLAQLTQLLQGANARTPEELCEVLLEQLDAAPEDDVVLLVLRAAYS